jgi:hypothetical protein
VTLTRARGNRVEYRLRLNVAASSVTDVVSFAGGLLFDYAAAGWEVRVMIGDRDDDRPIRVLGAARVDVDTLLDGPIWPAPPTALAVPLALYVGDARIRGHVLRALEYGGTEIIAWGKRSITNLNGKALIEHDYHCSSAARAFKAQALLAARSSPNGVTDLERFWLASPQRVAASPVRSRLRRPDHEPAVPSWQPL